MKKKSDHKIVKKNKKPQETTLDHKIMKKQKQNISFGSLKTNTELPVQRWWFKSTPKPRTIIFFNVSSLFITNIGAQV